MTTVEGVKSDIIAHSLLSTEGWGKSYNCSYIMNMVEGISEVTDWKLDVSYCKALTTRVVAGW